MTSTAQPYRTLLFGTFQILAPLLLLPFATLEATGDEPRHPEVSIYDRLNASASGDVEAGCLLLSELGCVNCHVAPESERERLRAMRAPRLLETRARGSVASRKTAAAIRGILEKPHRSRPGTRMPDLSLTETEIRALSALMAHRAQTRTVPAAELTQLEGDAGRGRGLYHRVGCVACHEPLTTPENLQEAQSAEKDSRGTGIQIRAATFRDALQLATFLRDPLAVRPDARMPDFKLSPQDALDIAMYLHPGTKTAGAKPGRDVDFLELGRDANLVKLGRKLYRDKRCGACHDSPESVPTTILARSLFTLSPETKASCLEATAGLPNFNLSARQIRDLRSAIRAVQEEKTEGVSNLRLDLLRHGCLACHVRDKIGRPDALRSAHFVSAVEADLGDEGRLPPPLDGVGRKLKSPWIRKVLVGDGAVRPYLATRMPSFGDAVADRITQAVLADREPEKDVVDVEGRNRYGRQLVGMDGLRCLTCHEFLGHPSKGIPALDLATTADRLRPTWFRDYMLEPASFRAGSRMPALWPEGRAVFKNVLGGDTRKQLDAIYVYLSEASHTRLPVGLESKAVFNIEPKSRPFIQRGFMEGAGTHAIAIGYPEGSHAVFDAKDCRWVFGWKGSYLDVEGVWDDRFSAAVRVLEEEHLSWPGTMPLALLQSDDQIWPDVRGEKAGYAFGGYRLDTKGVPTLLYTFKGYRVEDTLTSLETGGFERRLRLAAGESAVRGSLWFLVVRGDELKQQASGIYRGSNGQTWTLDGNLHPVLRVLGTRRELIAPVPVRDGAASWTLRWAW